MNDELIEKYTGGGEKLLLAIRGLDREDLLATPIAGKWSTHQVVIHLSDAEAAFADRIKRVIAMDEPVLLAWDENKYAANLHYNDQSTQDAVTFIDLTRKQIARILTALPDSALQRAGQHSERGRLTLADILGMAVWHLDHHLKFIYEKREKLGKMSW